MYAILTLPEPWTGKRVRVPRDTVANLAPIPSELTLNGTEIALRREALASLERMAAAASAYRWLRQHARHYGFYEPYHKNNTLGVIWEPWHWEYRLERQGPADRPTQPAASIDRQTTPTDAPQPAAAQDQSDSIASPEPEPETAPQ